MQEGGRNLRAGGSQSKGTDVSADADTLNAGEAYSNEHSITVTPQSDHVGQRIITVRGICKECGHETDIEIDRNDLIKYL